MERRVERRRGNAPEMPDIPDNAEESVKCPQCGNLVGITEFQAQQSAICPVCGTAMDMRQLHKFGGSNEEY